jgi:hypothetical protein
MKLLSMNKVDEQLRQASVLKGLAYRMTEEERCKCVLALGISLSTINKYLSGRVSNVHTGRALIDYIQKNVP